MIDRYGRWIAALIMLALLLAVVVLFSTVDLGMDGSTMTDVHSAPILSPDTTESHSDSSQPDEGYPPPDETHSDVNASPTPSQ